MMIEKNKKLGYVRNQRGTMIKRCCASCGLREYKDGIRFCTFHGEAVDAKDRCRKWQMSEGMGKAGIGTGVVRDIATKEVVF